MGSCSSVIRNCKSRRMTLGMFSLEIIPCLNPLKSVHLQLPVVKKKKKNQVHTSR